MFKSKVLVLGPCESGKSVLSNFLSDATESSGGEYHATQGVRILEFEVSNIALGGGRSANCEVELWDVSGDTKFENCWPAIARETNGVVFVFNPDQPNSDKQLESWYNYFVSQQNLRESQCVLFAHHKASGGNRADPDLPSSMSQIPCVHTCIEEDSEEVRTEFQTFLGSLIMSMSEKREQEELSIMNSR